ncbi:hypothetical protein [uncultured Chitinophaga sp.]|uniref:hypothetical protein n=1 Tax=uncultured Chitinophaga sp. TaxID=339340 RepID=UPI0025E2BF4C|nr:hypothetical protein [uncultured Chitinophaga sp.]
MKLSLDKYNLVAKELLGSRLKLIFEDKYEMDEKRVLELIDVIAFFDRTSENTEVRALKIDNDGNGTYKFDVAALLDQPEISDYSEVFLFSDAEGIGFVFRGLARQVNFRPFEKQDGA